MPPLVSLPFALVLLAAPAWASSLAPQPPSPLRTYTYSRDSAAGFEDERLDVFRRELGKHLGTVGELAYDRKDAEVSVQFLGQGDLTVELDDDGVAVRHLWRANDGAETMWALVRVGHFAKEFSLSGSGSRDLSRLAKNVADWVRQNAAAIRRRASPAFR